VTIIEKRLEELDTWQGRLYRRQKTKDKRQKTKDKSISK
jgi:hypothetical protein